MANEISVATTLRCSNGNFQFLASPPAKSFDQTNNGGGNPGMVSFTTSEEDISFGDLTAAGWFHVHNLDTGNSVILGPKSSGNCVEFLRVPPGGQAIGYLGNGVTMRGNSTAGTVRVQISALDR